GRLLYYGALTYSVDIGNRKAIGLKDLKVRKYPMSVKLEFNKEKVKKSRDTLVSTSDYETQDLDMEYNEISGVPAWTSTDDGNANVQYPNNVGPASDPWDDWDGCSPIAGSMVIGYYEPLLDKEEIIDILHHTMGTSTDGRTNFWNVDNGIDDFDDEYTTLLNSGIVTQPISHWFDGSNDWYVSTSDIIREIDNSRPFILSMTDAGSSTDGVGPYNDHSVAVVGYWYWQSDEDYEFYLIIHNTWDSEEHYFAYGNWDIAVATYVYAYS
ncbi:C39 family peptidase, partial [Thermococcus sp.]